MMINLGISGLAQLNQNIKIMTTSIAGCDLSTQEDYNDLNTLLDSARKLLDVIDYKVREMENK